MLNGTLSSVEQLKWVGPCTWRGLTACLDSRHISKWLVRPDSVAGRSSFQPRHWRQLPLSGRGAHANTSHDPNPQSQGLKFPTSSCALDAMDLTPIFNDLLGKHNAPQTRKKYSVSDIDGFLKEAYRIVRCSRENSCRPRD